jgi:hypothetical protein
VALNIPEVVEYILDTRFFHHDEKVEEVDPGSGGIAIPHIWTPGDSESKFLLVLGDNAGGKSFFRRLFREVTRKGRKAHGFNKAVEPGPFPLPEVIHLSMEARAGSSMNPVVKQMIYGGEEWLSTGYLTSSFITKGIKSASGRDHEVALYWDEPCVGMSARCQMGAGITIREFVDNLPEHIVAVVITTHSPWFVEQVLMLAHTPHYLYLGSSAGPETLEQWIESERNPVVPIAPEVLDEACHQRHSAINAILNNK